MVIVTRDDNESDEGDDRHDTRADSDSDDGDNETLMTTNVSSWLLSGPSGQRHSSTSQRE